MVWGGGGGGGGGDMVNIGEHPKHTEEWVSLGRK